MFRVKQEVSIAEIVTVATAGAITISAIYNWGYFVGLQASILSLLTWQDLIYGAAIGLISTVIGGYVGMFLSEVGLRLFGRTSLPLAGWFVDVTPEYKGGRSHIVVTALAGSVFALGLIFIESIPAGWKFISPVVCYLAVMFAMPQLTFVMTPRQAMIVAALFAIGLAYAAGRSAFDTASTTALNRNKSDVITFEDGRSLSLDIIRFTSSYGIAVRDGAILLFPMSDVKKIWRNETASTERQKI